MFVVAVVLDTTYQILFLKCIYPIQLLVVAVACGIVPYMLVRGSATCIARLLRRNRPPAAALSGTAPGPGGSGRE